MCGWNHREQKSNNGASTPASLIPRSYLLSQGHRDLKIRARFLRTSPQVACSGWKGSPVVRQKALVLRRGKEEALFCSAVLLFSPVSWLLEHPSSQELLLLFVWCRVENHNQIEGRVLGFDWILNQTGPIILLFVSYSNVPESLQILIQGHWKYANFCRISGFWDSNFPKPASRFQHLILVQCYLQICSLKYGFIFPPQNSLNYSFIIPNLEFILCIHTESNFFYPILFESLGKELFIDFKIFVTVILRVELCHPAFIWNTYRHALHLHTC